MRFAPTDDQQQFRSVIATVTARASRPQDVRAAWAGQAPKVWEALEAAGFHTILAPEEFGGGGSDLEFVAALEELGRAAAPGPLVEHAGVGVPLLAALDEKLLAKVLEDRLVLTATASDLVPYAAQADAVLLLDPGSVRYLELAPGTVEPLPTGFDHSRDLARVTSAGQAGAVVVADGHRGAEQVGLAQDRAALGTAAFLVGLASSMIAQTVKYASARTQFGVPIGSFQAVQHLLADAWKDTEFARPAVEAAAWALREETRDASRACSMAKVLAESAARRTAKVSLQCHGAIGYTMEADLHLWLMRVWSLQGVWGSTDEHRERVAASLLETP